MILFIKNHLYINRDCRILQIKQFNIYNTNMLNYFYISNADFYIMLNSIKIIFDKKIEMDLLITLLYKHND